MLISAVVDGLCKSSIAIRVRNKLRCTSMGLGSCTSAGSRFRVHGKDDPFLPASKNRRTCSPFMRIVRNDGEMLWGQ
jgi:hypothetical protein